MEMTFFQKVEAGVAGRLLRAGDSFVDRFTRDRWEVDGELLDRRAQYVFTVGRFAERFMPDMSPTKARHYYARLCRVLEAPPPAIGDVTELTIPTRAGERPGRAYHPSRTADGGSALPGLVYFHGGGFTIGSLETHDTLCRRICDVASCVVVAVDYRLAPEHPFPAAVDDCVDATNWVRDQAAELGIDQARLAVGGDSAGGNLATVVCALARDGGRPLPAAQLLMYPGVGTVDHPGRRKPELQTGYGLDAPTTRWFFENYTGEANESDPRVAPLHMSSHAGLPSAIVVTAHFDLLCGEGIEYVEKLRAAGVPVNHLHVPDLPHGFGTMSVIPRAQEAIQELSSALRDELQRR